MKKLFALIMVLLLLVGCSGGNGGGTEGGGGSSEPADATKTVTVQAPTPIISMDHHIATDGTSFIAQTMCISGLMELDANGNPVEDMAESYTMSDDGLTYTFKIRGDANWSNGEPVCKIKRTDFGLPWNNKK